MHREVNRFGLERDLKHRKLKKGMHLVETEEAEILEEMCGDHPYITSPGENPEDRQFFLLKDGDETVGCGYIRTFMEKIGNIGAVFVEERRRGEGLGKFLLEELEKRLKEEGAAISVIGVHKENQRVKELWEEAGYHVLVESLGENVFQNENIAPLLQKISPKPLPDKGVAIMVKRLERDEDHPFAEEMNGLKEFLEKKRKELNI
ncbi:MAG: GNAT family N-acetyltransferase [Candidatus Aenigmatarchaeota archaeon]